MGFTPTCHQIVYLFGKESNRMFWMYDDRGCLAMSNDKSDLNELFDKYKKWLVEGYDSNFKQQ